MNVFQRCISMMIFVAVMYSFFLSMPLHAQTTSENPFTHSGSYLTVSPNKRYLMHAHDGQPFFILADTAWELTRIVKPADIPFYLDTRKQQGFTAFLMPIITLFSPFSSYPSINQPVFSSGKTPNETFFKHVDSIVEQARQRGMLVIMLPAFGWHQSSFSPSEGRSYGSYIGSRYSKYPNVIYMLVGDNAPTTNPEMHKQMAAGIRASYKTAGKPAPLISAHVGGASTKSSYFIPQTATDADGNLYLDFNTMQTGHSTVVTAYRWLLDDYKLTPIKPTFDGESTYENITGIGDLSDGKRSSTDLVRRTAYYTYLSGALGHTYGNIDVSVFYDPATNPDPAGFFGSNTAWKTAINWPAAQSMIHLNNFFRTRKWHLLIPNEIDPFLTSAVESGNSYKAAALASDKSWAAVYLPEGGTISINMAKFTQPVISRWFNPKTGSYTGAEGPHQPTGTKSFTAVGANPDAMLVLETQPNNTTPTITPTVSVIVTQPDGCPKKTQGDADCDEKINLLDFEIWRKEFMARCKLSTPTLCAPDDDKNGIMMDADFNDLPEPSYNNEKGVTIIDFEIWRKRFAP